MELFSQMIEMLQPYRKEPFWYEERMRVEFALSQFLEQQGLDVDESDFALIEEVDLRDGEYLLTLGVNFSDYDIRLLAYYDYVWNFCFYDVVKSRIESDGTISPSKRETKRERLLNLLSTFKEDEPFWEDKNLHMNDAIEEFLEANRFDTSKFHIDCYPIRSEGTDEKKFFSVKINKLQVNFKVLAILENGKYFYYIEEIDKSEAKLTTVQTVAGGEYVFVGYESAPSGLQLFLVPKEVAISIGIEEFDGQQFHNSTEDEVLDLIREFEVKNFVSFYNID